MPDDFDSPVSIADEHTRAAMSDADRNRLAEHALDAATAAGLPRTKGLTEVVYAAVNGLRVLGGINVGLADVGLELGTLVRVTALAGLVQAQGAADTGAISAAVLSDLEAIAAEDDADDDEAADDAVAQAAGVLHELDDEGRRAIADALLDPDGVSRASFADLLDHYTADDGDGGDDDDEGGDRVR